jgi:hypothetical protein
MNYYKSENNPPVAMPELQLNKIPQRYEQTPSTCSQLSERLTPTAKMKLFLQKLHEFKEPIPQSCPNDHELQKFNIPVERFFSHEVKDSGIDIFCMLCDVDIDSTEIYYRCAKNSCNFDLCSACASC